VVVTLDADFHAILAVQNASKPSVIRVRIQGLNGPAIAALVFQVLEQYAPELESGCMITVKSRKTTCHLLSNT
jgi:predicted nuclease of predicted toxin-antitoxin system